jgi:hypothetical protein
MFRDSPADRQFWHRRPAKFTDMLLAVGADN